MMQQHFDEERRLRGHWLHSWLPWLMLTLPSLGCSGAPAPSVFTGGDDGTGDADESDLCAAISCPEHQSCEAATGLCACVHGCAAVGPECDPAGTNQIGTCVEDEAACRLLTELTACPGAAQVCPAGATSCSCPAESCPVGLQRCSDTGDVQVCGTDSTGCTGWITTAVCGERQICIADATGAACLCVDGCPALDATQCQSETADLTDYLVCSLDASGCRYWAPATCPSPEECDSAAAAAGTEPPCACPATPVCTLGDTRCQSDGVVEECRADAGCPDWVVAATCAASSEHCVDTGATAACACVNTDCTSAGQALCDAAAPTSETICTPDAASTLGCFVKDVSACTSSLQTCVAGEGCSCTAEQCDLWSFAATCEDNVLHTCRADDGGCGVLTNVDCGVEVGPSSSCIAGPPAHCDCPAPSGDALYVDGAAGSDEGGTGAASPPSCAFGSITKALASLGGAFDTVIVRPPSPATGSYSPGAPNAETLPLVLAAGVTLTSDAAAPADSIVVDSAGAATAPQALLSKSGVGAAVVHGLSLTDSAKNVATALVSCDGGTLAIEDSTLSGAKAAGLRVAGSCAATLAGTWRIEQSGGAGVSVGAVGAQLTLDGTGEIVGNATGVQLGAGVVTTAAAPSNPVITVRDSTSGPNVQLSATTATSPSFTCRGCVLRQAATAGLQLATGAASGIAVLQGGSVLESGTFGAIVTQGTLTLSDGVEISGNTSGGIQLNADTAHLIASDGSPSATIRANGGPGLRVTNNAGAQAELTEVRLAGNDGAGIDMQNGVVTVDGASTINGNGGGTTKVPGINVGGGTLTLTGGATSLEIFENGAAGIDIGGGAVELTKVMIRNHAGAAGLVVGGAATTLVGDAIVVQANGTSTKAMGVLVNAGTVTLTSTGGPSRIGENGGGGLHCGATGMATCTLTGVEIASNSGGPGFALARSGAGATATGALADCDIHGNGGSMTVSSSGGGGSTTYAVGGIAVLNGTFSTFVRNRLHSNLNSEVLVIRATGGSLDLNPAVAGADCTNANQFYCYAGGAGDFAIEVASGAQSPTVDAANNVWKTATPAQDVDYTAKVNPGSGGQLCGAVTTCP